MREDKIILTGASRGIGEAIAKRLGKTGYHLLLLARTEIDLARVQRDIRQEGGKAQYYVCDFADSSSVEETILKVKSEHGDISQFIFNAGVSTNSEFYSHSMSSIEKEMEINYFSVLRILKKFLPYMIEKKRGSIVAIGSVMSLLPFPGNSSYAASKAALLSMLRSLRLELSKHDIFVSSVLPGLTRTDMTKDFHSFSLPFDQPEDVAACVEEALRSHPEIIIPGLLNNTVVNLYRWVPEVCNFILGNTVDFILPYVKPNKI
jgi:short-subunit dehydrogenase